jgi:hypothetical protein
MRLSRINKVTVACSFCLLASTLLACLPEALPAVAEPRSNKPNFQDISLPEGAGSDLAKKQLVVFLNISAIDAIKDAQFKFSKESLQIANIELEALLPRMKRFTVYSIYGDGAERKARELSDTGEMKTVDEKQLPKPDLFLNITKTLNCEVSHIENGDLLAFKDTLIYNMTDSSKKVLDDTPEASGTIIAACTREVTQKLNSKTHQIEYVGAYKPGDQESQANVIRALSADLLKGLAARLAKALPITTQVTNINPSKTMFSVRAGQKNGIFKGTEMVVWVSVDDFTYAIASGEAEPKSDSSNIKNLKWNESNPDGKAIVDKIKAEGFNDFKEKIWATSVGIPLKEMLAPSVSKIP